MPWVKILSQPTLSSQIDSSRDFFFMGMTGIAISTKNKYLRATSTLKRINVSHIPVFQVWSMSAMFMIMTVVVLHYCGRSDRFLSLSGSARYCK